MTSLALARNAARALPAQVPVPFVAAGIAFLLLFRTPGAMLLGDWWTDPEAGHGLLLAPLALYLAWKEGVERGARAQPVLGLAMLAAAALLRYAAELAAEWYTMRLSMLGAAFALVVFAWGGRQLLKWWLPALLLLLSIPLPAVVLESLALPLQLQASRLGASLLEWRFVPVLLAGNVIHLPGHALFVTEACSGLRSLTALISLGLLIGGLWLRFPLTRLLLLSAAIPIAILLNGLRVFLTGFLVYYVSPAFGDGLLHYTEGWVTFGVAFLLLGLLAWGLGRLESRVEARP